MLNVIGVYNQGIMGGFIACIGVILGVDDIVRLFGRLWMKVINFVKCLAITDILTKRKSQWAQRRAERKAERSKEK